jgi:ankyrin repeat protein
MMTRPEKTPNGADDIVSRAFALAVMSGDTDVVREALADGADVNGPGPGGLPLAVFAIARGETGVARLLIEAGADPGAVDPTTGMTALHLAAIGGHDELVDELIRRGADVDATSRVDPTTALGIACRRDHDGIVRRLLAAGADPNVTLSGSDDPPDQQDATPLHWASARGDAAMIRQLAALDADVEARKGDGLTPLMIATFGGHLAAVRALLDAGADVDAVCDADPARPITAGAIAQHLGHHQLAELLSSRSS